ncbi:MAG: transcriptional regulator GcvA [Rhodospirillaceae bacterium]|nr:transcriptional regulator GcvA [Rhodospirillaceae bacterium]
MMKNIFTELRRRNLPPLNALRAFEAAARHLSMTMAGEELGVSAPAISAHVRMLERDLGVRLFRRHHRALSLTDAGSALLVRLERGFDTLAEGVDVARSFASHRGPGGRKRLTVTLPPSLATRWLVPRLDRFAAQHPAIDTRIDATMRLVDFSTEDVDVAIRYGAGSYPGLLCQKLANEKTIAVCAPELAKRLQVPDDLAKATLIHVRDETDGRDRAPDWSAWLKNAEVTGCNADLGPIFSMQGMAAQAAIDGQGIALLGRTVVSLDLAAGRLVEPFSITSPVAFAIWFVCRPEDSTRDTVAAFREWLLADIKGEQPGEH